MANLTGLSSRLLGLCVYDAGGGYPGVRTWSATNYCETSSYVPAYGHSVAFHSLILGSANAMFSYSDTKYVSGIIVLAHNPIHPLGQSKII